MIKNVYRHIIWDWNGTIFDDAWLSVDVMNGLLSRRNMPLINAELYQTLFDFPVVEYYRRLGFTFQEESFEKVGMEFIVEYEKRKIECSLREGAYNVISKLASCGLSQSLLSAYRHENLNKLVEQFGITCYFSHILGHHDDYASGKIDNAKLLINMVGIEPENILLVGDTCHDYEVSKCLGTACMLIPSGHHPRTRLESCSVRILNSLDEIPVLLTGRPDLYDLQ